MGLPKVAITLGNGNLGRTVVTDDGVAGLILTGLENGLISLNQPKVIYSLSDAENLGIKDTNLNFDAYARIKEFYDLAGEGAELYIMLVGDGVNQATIVDPTNAEGAVKLLNAAQGRIRLLGVCFTPSDIYLPLMKDGLDAGTIDAVPKAQQLAETYAAQFKPVRILLEGVNADIEHPETLKNLRTFSDNRVGIVIGSARTNGASVGLVLGRAAAVPVQRNLGRVKDGALPITGAYIAGKKIEDITGVDALHDKGYIFFRTFVGRSGYYINDDPMCAPTTDDYSQLASGRVVDKAITLCYQTYVEELNDEVAIDADGKLSVPVIKYLQSRIETAVNTSMADEISSFSAYVDANQNVLSTGKITVKAAIVPVGYTKTIEILLGFTNPALNQ
ncbi:DUF2586 family protein [Chitinophaga sp. LS1]|uniref:DUF2586 family protein n=1 Tax=Chitinophaga sp. LS1 TaxID=3051176 RepID=UPI002AABF1A4|nr:DUF2586 family protein [Chitinophaga sp. LS1]WPV66590.1 DUF2586 family protein [Chitinophaga sp. LS1]